MKQVLPDDVVFHLCGDSPSASFVGHSIAASGCAAIEAGPDGAQELYRVELSGYTELSPKARLRDAFDNSNEELRGYFQSNKKRRRDKERLFYVIQSGRIQCLNGAYLSYVSNELLTLLFGITVHQGSPGTTAVTVATAATTGTQFSLAAQRVGQQAFSRNVRENCNHRCCFPGCEVTDDRFLVGAHIARWADAPELRGSTSNGLCLCLVHDRAFEVGAFTVSTDLRIVLSTREPEGAWIRKTLAAAEGEQLAHSQVVPAASSLAIHRRRHGYKLEG